MLRDTTVHYARQRVDCRSNQTHIQFSKPMKFYLFMKYWSLAWMSASIGAAIVYVLQHNYLYAIQGVVCCALNHICYNVWNKQIKDTETK